MSGETEGVWEESRRGLSVKEGYRCLGGGSRVWKGMRDSAGVGGSERGQGSKRCLGVWKGLGILEGLGL